MVIPEIETVTVLELMWKTRAVMTLLSTCTVKWVVPGPVMVRFLSITNSPLVRVTIVTLGAKLIASPGEASKEIACRKEPDPLSFPLVTVIVAARALVVFNKSAAITQAR
jgi:hypothetical protein